MEVSGRGEKRSNASPARSIDIRAPIGIRISAGLFAIAGVVGMATTIAKPIDLVAALLVTAPLLLLLWRVSTPRLHIDGRDFVIRNYVRTRRVPIDQVDRFDVGGGYYGIQLWLKRSYETITINAIQKSNWATWTGKNAPADVLVTKLNDLVRERQSQDPAER